MGTSTLIKEDDEFLYLQKYIHDDSDEVPKWANEDNQHWVEIAETAFYEVKCLYRIRKSNGEVIYDSFE